MPMFTCDFVLTWSRTGASDFSKKLNIFISVFILLLLEGEKCMQGSASVRGMVSNTVKVETVDGIRCPIQADGISL